MAGVGAEVPASTNQLPAILCSLTFFTWGMGSGLVRELRTLGALPCCCALDALCIDYAEECGVNELPTAVEDAIAHAVR